MFMHRTLSMYVMYYFYHYSSPNTVWKKTSPSQRQRRRIRRRTTHRSPSRMCTLPPSIQRRNSHLYHRCIHELRPNQRRSSILHNRRRPRLLPHRSRRPRGHSLTMPSSHSVGTTCLHVSMCISYRLCSSQSIEIDKGAVGWCM